MVPPPDNAAVPSPVTVPVPLSEYVVAPVNPALAEKFRLSGVCASVVAAKRRKRAEIGFMGLSVPH